ncbi:hypothetical protein AOQ73_22435 [Bradyrhizobium pachyrhizi]|nr:hypothetical protein AOQ73_22435 [Bradyrhizobium pachyrhizi]
MALLRQRLQLLGLSREVRCGNLVAPQRQRRLVGHHRDGDGADRGNAPRAEPPQHAAIQSILLGQKAGGALGVEFRRQIVAIFGQSPLGPPQGPPNHEAKINRKWTGNLNPERHGGESVSSAGENN